MCSPSLSNIVYAVVPRSFPAPSGQYWVVPLPWQLKQEPPSNPLECVWQFVHWVPVLCVCTATTPRRK